MTLTTIATLVFAAYLVPLGLGWRGLSAVLSLGLFLPLVNAVFDFLSFGLTRWVLRNGVERITWSTLGWGTTDLLVSALDWIASSHSFLLDAALGVLERIWTLLPGP